jgi:S-adenosylmethionine:diacylglycerol 3-amino-3-carboxypropyl transferase
VETKATGDEDREVEVEAADGGRGRRQLTVRAGGFNRL